MAHRVTFIPGDGTGPELAEATRRVLEATGVEFEWDFQDAGIDVYEEEGNPLPDRTLDSIRERGVAIKGPTTTPVGSGHRSINVALRKQFDLYSCIRPCKSYEGVRTRFPETDLVIVRENTEDLYAGIEFERGSQEIEKLRRFLADELASPTREDAGISIKPISVFGSERIVESAFAYAEEYGRSKVTAAHKANIMKYSDGLFLEVAREVAGAPSGHRVRGPDHRQPVQPAGLAARGVRRGGPAQPLRRHRLRPRRRPDRRPRAGARGEHRHGRRDLRGHPRLGAQVQGPEQGEPHGADALRRAHAPAPGQNEEADRLENAIAAVIAKGDKVTYDLKPTRDDPSAVGTSDFADAVIEEMQ